MSLIVQKPADPVHQRDVDRRWAAWLKEHLDASTYTLNVPAGQTGDQQISALNILRLNAVNGAVQILAKPDPLIVRWLSNHSADTDGNYRISLFELTRVIEIFNTRNGTNRTRSYRVDAGGEDGFNPEPTRAGGAVVTLVKDDPTGSCRES